MNARQLGIVRNYDDLHAVLRQRCEELNVARLTVDAIAGLPSGYTGKLLGPNQVKGLGRVSLGPMLGALGLKIIVVEDEEALQQVQSRLVPRVYARPLIDGGRGEESGSLGDAA